MIWKRVIWWLWFATAVSLGVDCAGRREGVWAAIGFTALNMVVSALSDGRSFPLEVRRTYLAILVIGLWPPLFFLHVIQFVGTWALVLADYCFLARCLSLLPWNRHAPLTAALLWRTFLSKPVAGSFVGSQPGYRLAPGSQSTSLPPLAARAATKR